VVFVDLQFARGARTAPSFPAAAAAPAPPEWLGPFARAPEPVEPESPSFWRRVIAAARKVLGTREAIPPPPPLLPAGETTGPVPEFVRSAAREMGVELAGLQWSLVSENVASRPRAVFDVHDPVAADGERYTVKIAWHPQVNPGIENEHWALRALTARKPVASHTYPQPAFLAIRGSVVLSGHEDPGGRPFAECTDGTATCSHAERALGWLVDMAAGTFRPRETFALAGPLEEIVERYAMKFGPSAEAGRFLHTQAEMLVSSGSIPTVLHHGDPDPARNVRVSADGAPVFLGWEECALEGLPLWDLYWFAQAYGRMAMEREDARYDAAAFATQFLERTFHSVALVRAVAASCERLALSPRLASPLFHLGWATLAVRGGPQADVYAEILDRCVAAEQRDGGLAVFNG
jgi:hypothetical protein